MKTLMKFYSLFLLFLPSAFVAQNLIPDPGFEVWDGTIGANPNTLGGLILWNEINGTPDHHHVDNPPGSNLTSLEPCPLGNGQNQCGTPLEGDAVLGCYKANGVDGTKEWAAIQMDPPMIPGICYNVSFWVQNKKDNPNFIMETNQWGMFFNDAPTPAFDPNTVDFNTLTNQFVTSDILVNDTIWHHIELTYEPDDAYDHAYIGYMGNVNDAVTNAWSMSGSVGFYVWIDSVEVTPAEIPFLTPSADINACVGEEFQIFADSNLPITWSTGQIGDTLSVTPLIPGVITYDVFAGQGAACELMETITVNVIDCNCPAPITASVSSTDATNCPYDPLCDGTATATPDNGNPPFDFSWDDPLSQNTSIATDLCPGTYICTVQDADGCETTAEVTIEGPAEALYVFDISPVTCAGLLDGAIDIQMLDGEDPFTFEWNGIASPEDIAGLDTGFHYLTIFDAAGCQYDAEAYVPLSDNDVIEIIHNTELCIDQTPLVLDGTLGSGIWSGPGIIDAVTGLFDPSMAGGGIQELTFISDSDCNTEYSYEVVVRPEPLIDITIDPGLGCADLDVGFSMFGPVQSSYEWSMGDSTFLDTAPPFSYTYTEEGVYDIGLTVTDAFGCDATDTVHAAVQVIAQPQAQFTYTPTDPTDYAPEVTFTSQTTGASIWEWDLGNGESGVDSIVSTTYPGPGDYLVWLKVESGSGCVDSVMQIVRYRGEVVLYVPTGFSPDGDGLNEYFQVVTNSDIDLYRIEIFDRWGRVVFESEDINERWNGEVDSQWATPDHLYYALDGVYTYVITYSTRFASSSAIGSERLVGTIFIMR